MTGFGMADKRIRNFVRMLQQKISISMFDIADPDLYGLLIIKTYVKGSIALGHDNFSLAVVSIHCL
jgi:DNA topoisomerase VI subunit A